MAASKNQFPSQFNWQSSTPVPFKANLPLSGVTAGAMASTNTIYSNILDISNYDNSGLEISWTGTPTGTVSVLGSVSGTFFFPLTFNPVLGQPAGSAGGYGVDLNFFPWKFIMLQYVNASGSGSLSAYAQYKAMS